MTTPDPSTTTEGTGTVSTDPSEGAAGTEGTDPPEGKDDDQPSKEAAKYRTRLRAAEVERDAVREQLAAIRRQAAEDASGLMRPAGLWAAGVDLDALYDDDGRLDREKLSEAVTAASDALGLTRAPRVPKPDPSQGRTSSRPSKTSWADVIKR